VVGISSAGFDETGGEALGAAHRGLPCLAYPLEHEGFPVVRPPIVFMCLRCSLEEISVMQAGCSFCVVGCAVHCCRKRRTLSNGDKKSNCTPQDKAYTH